MSVIKPRQWPVSAAGALGAIALHLLFLSALTLGAGAAKPPSHSSGDSDIQVSRPHEGVVSAIVYLDPTLLARDAGISSPPFSLKLKHIETPRLMRLAAPDLPSADADGATRDASSAATIDGAARAMLFGRYVNQITARIERTWVRPITAPSGRMLWERRASATPLFKCRVQILQSRAGTVLEVTLISCDSSPEWQQSLVRAIDAASPLPSPPSASVFARSLILNFTSMSSLSDRKLRTGSTGSVRRSVD